MDDRWDAVVIGAGPAGSVAARELARLGNRVLLVDRAAFPRNKVCGCCLNGNALASLRRLGISGVLADGVSLHSMTLAAGGRTADVKLNDGIALSRSSFDLALVNEARAAGVIFLDGTTAKIGSASVDGIHIHVGSREIVAKVAILAKGLSGHDSHVEPGSRIGGGAIVAESPGFYSAGRLFMACGRGGYVGLVRFADGSLDIAAAFDAAFVQSSGGLGHAAEAILSVTKWPAIRGLADLPWKGTPALTRRRIAIAEPRVFAVGDATGYVEPFTGEGMAWALSSAAALAPIAHRAIRMWNDDCIAEWRRVHARIVGRRQWLCRAASRVLRSPWLTGLAVKVLSIAPVLARPVVRALDRASRS